jgi:cytochrome c553
MPHSKTSLTIAALTAGVLALAMPLAGTAQDGAPFSGGPTADDLARGLEGADDLERRLREAGDAVAVPGSETVDVELLQEGRLVAMGGSESGGASMACITCHGADGRGDGSGAWPRLTGQPAWYLYKQLVDYASGARPNRVMSGIAERLTASEMEAVAAYYAVQSAPYRPVRSEVNGLTLQWGGQLAAVGSAEKGIPACVNCHGASGSGLPPSVPYLAGQYVEYTVLQLELWKGNIRDNDAMNVMSTIADKMSEEDIRAVAEYYARVRPPEVAAAAVGEPVVMQAPNPIAESGATALLPLD